MGRVEGKAAMQLEGRGDAGRCIVVHVPSVFRTALHVPAEPLRRGLVLRVPCLWVSLLFCVDLRARESCAHRGCCCVFFVHPLLRPSMQRSESESGGVHLYDSILSRRELKGTCVCVVCLGSEGCGWKTCPRTLRME